MPTERELKFSLVDDFPDVAELTACFKQGEFELVVKPTQKQFDSYYDDDQQSLRKSGLALRRRRIDGRSLATLKGNVSKEGALHQREELEEAMIGNAWPQAIFERIQAVTNPEHLKEHLELSTLRRRYLIKKGQKDLAILSLDKVSAGYPGKAQSVDFEEVEIEALGGTNDDLQAIAEALRQLISLSPNSVNKLERAEVLLQLSDSFQGN
jgi:inorganic triphosphatase YgiF